MRRTKQDRTKAVVCRLYERLRRKWKKLIDETAAAGSSADSSEATADAHCQMVQHREDCDVCKRGRSADKGWRFRRFNYYSMKQFG